MSSSLSRPQSIGGLGVVTVFIGLNRTPFTVHCDFLCRASSYFNDQIPAEHRLTTNGLQYPISKLDEDTKIADIFFLWIYTREYSLSGDISQGSLPDACVTQAIRLYCFAIKFGVPDLSLSILEELFTLMQKKQIQFKYSQLELVWEAEYTDTRLQTLVLLYIAYAPGALSYDEIDIYNWLRDHGSIAVDLLRMQKERYTNPNAKNPFDQSFAHKTFGESALKEKAHEQDGGRPNKPSHHPIQRKADRQTGTKVPGAQRNGGQKANKKQKSNTKCGNDPRGSQKRVDQHTQGVEGSGNESGNTENGNRLDTATQAGTKQSDGVHKGDDQHADAQNGGEQGGNKRKLGVNSDKSSSSSKKARKRSDDSGGNMDGETLEYPHRELRRNPARRTVGGLRPYRGKV